MMANKRELQEYVFKSIIMVVVLYTVLLILMFSMDAYQATSLGRPCK